MRTTLLPKKPLAFLTMEDTSHFVTYDHLAKRPLAERGWATIEVPWTSPDVDWNQFAAVVIRSPWDYHHRLDEFLAVIDTIEASEALLLNSAAIVRWNVDKTYLRGLEQRGLPIVPTQWLKSPTRGQLASCFEHFATDEIVIKPTIGAGATDTFRIKLDRWPAQDLELLYKNRMAMVQPFLPSIIQQGEWSLFYFGGRYSHTILKTPAPGDFRVQEEYGSHLVAVVPSDDLLVLAEAAVDAIIEPTAYARVDLVRLPDDSPALIELELIEPSLYFPFCEASPSRFAAAIDQRLSQRVAGGPVAGQPAPRQRGTRPVRSETVT